MLGLDGEVVPVSGELADLFGAELDELAEVGILLAESLHCLVDRLASGARACTRPGSTRSNPSKNAERASLRDLMAAWGTCRTASPLDISLDIQSGKVITR